MDADHDTPTRGDKPDAVEPMPILEMVRKCEPPQLMYTQVAVRYAILEATSVATAAERERCEQWITDHLDDAALESFRDALREGD